LKKKFDRRKFLLKFDEKTKVKMFIMIDSNWSMIEERKLLQSIHFNYTEFHLKSLSRRINSSKKGSASNFIWKGKGHLSCIEEKHTSWGCYSTTLFLWQYQIRERMYKGGWKKNNRVSGSFLSSNSINLQEIRFCWNEILMSH
jgi:hypothetical protein